MSNNGSLFGWNFLLEHLIGEKKRSELAEYFSISYPSVIRKFDLCEKIESSDTIYTGICLETMDSVYVSKSSFSQDKTSVVKFSDISHLKGEPNCFIDLPNRHEVLLRYYQKVYATKHIRLQNAIVIEENYVTVMIEGYIFERLGNFSTLNMPFILEAYQPELIIMYEEEKERFNAVKNQLDFITMKKNGQLLLTEFITPEIISIANANWGVFLSLINA